MKNYCRGLITWICICALSAVSIFCMNTAGTAAEEDKGQNSQSTIYVNTCEEFEQFIEQINAGNTFKDMTIRLTRDLYFNEGIEPIPWEFEQFDWELNISSNAQLLHTQGIFEGTFDGQYHTLYNLYSKEGGVFDEIGANGTVKNLGVAGGLILNISGDLMHVGSICNRNKGIISDCYNKRVIQIERVSNVGGIAGLNQGIIVNCYNQANLYAFAKEPVVGGIAGSSSRDGNYCFIENCYNTGNIFVTSSWVQGYGAGIVGKNREQNYIGNCYDARTERKTAEIGGNSKEDTAPIAVHEDDFHNWRHNFYRINNDASGGVDLDESKEMGKTETQMRSQEFVQELNAYVLKEREQYESMYHLALWGIAPAINDGFPVFDWQIQKEQKLSLEIQEKKAIVGESFYLVPIGTLADSVAWTSSNPQTVTVDQNGNVHVLAEGEAVISCSANNGSDVSSCTVKAALKWETSDPGSQTTEKPVIQPGAQTTEKPIIQPGAQTTKKPETSVGVQNTETPTSQTPEQPSAEPTKSPGGMPSQPEHTEPGTTLKLGDVNNDKSIDLTDANLTLRFALAISLADETFYEKAADLDGDGLVTLADANRILKAALGIITLDDNHGN